MTDVPGIPRMRLPPPAPMPRSAQRSHHDEDSDRPSSPEFDGAVALERARGLEKGLREVKDSVKELTEAVNGFVVQFTATKARVDALEKADSERKDHRLRNWGFATAIIVAVIGGWATVRAAVINAKSSPAPAPVAAESEEEKLDRIATRAANNVLLGYQRKVATDGLSADTITVTAAPASSSPRAR